MEPTSNDANSPVRAVREFGGIALSCAVGGVVIGALDGAAMAMSVVFHEDLGVSKTQVVWPGALMASGVGAIVGMIVGVPLYYLLLNRQLAPVEFLTIAAVSLIGGATVCLLTGRFALEGCWLATPIITILASVALKVRRPERK